jgi:hypothetical protein
MVVVTVPWHGVNVLGRVVRTLCRALAGWAVPPASVGWFRLVVAWPPLCYARVPHLARPVAGHRYYRALLC